MTHLLPTSTPKDTLISGAKACFFSLILLFGNMQCNAQERNKTSTPSATPNHDSIKSLHKYNLESLEGWWHDGSEISLKGRKAYVEYDTSEKKFKSFDQNGKLMPIDWGPALSNSKKITRLNIPGLMDERKDKKGFIRRSYRLDNNFSNTNAILDELGLKVPFEHVRKSKYLYIYFRPFLLNGAGAAWRQSEYIATLLRVKLKDSTAVESILQYSEDGNSVFETQVLKIYKANGALFTQLETKELMSSQLWISQDGKFFLTASSIDIGDDEGYKPQSPFLLYNIETKKIDVIPHSEHDKEKFPDGIGELRHAKFDDSTFQLVFYNGPDIGTRIMIDPYHRTIYYRHYPSPTFQEVYKSYNRIVPATTPDGRIINPEQYLRISF
jgi:hypothetical protein